MDRLQNICYSYCVIFCDKQIKAEIACVNKGVKKGEKNFPKMGKRSGKLFFIGCHFQLKFYDPKILADSAQTQQAQALFLQHSHLACLAASSSVVDSSEVSSAFDCFLTAPL